LIFSLRFSPQFLNISIKILDLIQHSFTRFLHSRAFSPRSASLQAQTPLKHFLLQFAIVDFQNNFELAKCFHRFFLHSLNERDLFFVSLRFIEKHNRYEVQLET
jgi:hypothetical protein